MASQSPMEPPLPWSDAYSTYHTQFIALALQSPELRQIFVAGAQLPRGYGRGMDERCIEYPWFFARSRPDARIILDAGSALNRPEVIAQPFWNDKKLTVLTLAPDEHCFWQRGISYHFGDLRDLPFRDGYFDEVACISTLEHIGMDNAFYTGQRDGAGPRPLDFQLALHELRRVIKPGGRLLLTVPFGKYQQCAQFQQFDAELLGAAEKAFAPSLREERFYFHTSEGWQLAGDPVVCKDLEYSAIAIRSAWGADPDKLGREPDGAAAARCVACCIWIV